MKLNKKYSAYIGSNKVTTKYSFKKHFSCIFRNEPEFSSLLHQSSSLSIQQLSYDLENKADRNFETIPSAAIDPFTH